MKPFLATDTIIDLLASGFTIPDICRVHNIKIGTMERRMARLKEKHDCKTVTQLVVKLKVSGVSTT